MNPDFVGTPHPAFYGITIKDRNNLTFNQNLLNSKIIPEFIKFRTLLKSRARVTPPPYSIVVYCLSTAYQRSTGFYQGE